MKTLIFHVSQVWVFVFLTVVSIKFSFSSVERKDTSFVINQITNFTQKRSYNVDPDSMTYEELLELGETVGTQNRGLSQELISVLPISKYKRSFFSKRKSRSERCVICQMEYKRGDRQITLPCKHIYHAGCGTRWLSINKACPICYTVVFGDASKH
uniref:RING-type domain-containing protein n=1 Tax=Salix viminalis TaxID=40686 RepID=A0A6N2M965_SALVM